MSLRVASFAVAMSFLTACSGSLQTLPDLTRTQQLNHALPGASYALPKLEYDLEVRQYLQSCPGAIAADGKATRLSFAVEVKAEPQYQQGERYLVDFSKLGGIARTGKFDIEWHPNGTLKSLGATADDKTGEILVDLTKAALSVWSMKMPVSRSSSMAGDGGKNLLANAVQRVKHIACSSAAKADVALLTARIDDLEGIKGKADKIVKYTERAISRATLRLLTKRDREQLSARFEALEILEAQSRTLSSEIETIKGRLGSINKVNWSGSYRAAHDEQEVDLALSLADVAKLQRLLVESVDTPPTSLLFDVAVQEAPACYGAGANVSTCLKELTDIDSGLATDAPIQRRCAVPDEGEPNKPSSADCITITGKTYKAVVDAGDRRPDRGVFVRDPVIGRLLICRATRSKCDIAGDKAGLEPSFMPQFGQLRFIPFVVRPFEGRSLSLQLSEDGRVTKLSYSTDKAMLATMAKAAADITGQVDAAIDKRETKRRSDQAYFRAQAIEKEQGAIDAINRQLTMKEAIAKRDNPLAPMTAETVQLQTESALIVARRTKLEAEAALQALTTPSS